MSRRAGLLLSLLLICAAARADGIVTAGQRELFRATDAALAAGDSTAFMLARPALRNYPLYPYLLYRNLKQRLDEFPVAEVRAFMLDYADLPAADALRRDWLYRLAEAQRWEDFLDDYRATGDVTLDCYRRQALLSVGKTREALDGIEALWVHGYSRPEACDPVFAVWRERGGFTQDRIWRRFRLAMRAGQDGLGRYLRKLLHGNRQAAATLWLAVEADPTRILDAGRFDPADPYTFDILLHGLMRWSSRDSVAAAAAYDTLKRRYRLPQDAGWEALQRRLSLFVATRGHPSAMRRLDALPERLVDEPVEEWRVRVALQHRDWTVVLRQIERMRSKTAAQPQWRYWRARALAGTGDEAGARAGYRALADERDYYGFLAADRLGRAHHIEHRPVSVDDAVLQAFADRPGVIRARELFLLDRLPQARLEWQQSLADAGRAQWRAAARLAHGWGWHDRAIAALARSGDWDDLKIRFPLPHRDALVGYARERGLDPAWVYAVMRQESLFQTDARSGAGALGLMQILPATGRDIADDLGSNWTSSYALLQPGTNIRFGTYYLRHTLDKLQGNPLLATAAYNAGPYRVVDWLPQDAAVPADLWAELIPYSETRKYVKNVMEFAAVFAWRLGESHQSLSERMASIRPQRPGA